MSSPTSFPTSVPTPLTITDDGIQGMDYDKNQLLVLILLLPPLIIVILIAIHLNKNVHREYAPKVDDGPPQAEIVEKAEADL